MKKVIRIIIHRISSSPQAKNNCWVYVQISSIMNFSLNSDHKQQVRNFFSIFQLRHRKLIGHAKKCDSDLLNVPKILSRRWTSQQLCFCPRAIHVVISKHKINNLDRRLANIFLTRHHRIHQKHEPATSCRNISVHKEAKMYLHWLRMINFPALILFRKAILVALAMSRWAGIVRETQPSA